MLPAIVFTVASVLINVETSPVYNMQPAYITANIGTTGRNIRNLPCISRKNNQSGVCMFAIDCLKSNGTHLGTCIDRFYFGSCCHIEPLNDVIDNSIEPALFPDKSREPPARLSTTEKLVESTTTAEPSTTVKTSTPAEVSSSTMIELRQPVKVSTTTTTSTTSTTTTRTTTTTTTTPRPTTTTTIKTEVTTRAPVILTKEPSTTETNDIYKLTTFQSVEGNEIQTTLRPITLVTKPSTTVSTPKPTKSSTLEPITVSVPLVTRPPSKSTTPKPVVYVKPLTQKPATNKPTPRPGKPKPAQVSTKPTGKPTLKPRPKPTRPLQKLTTKPTSKPIKYTTKPPRNPASTTKAPINIKPTRRPVINGIPTASTIVGLQHGTTERITTQNVPETTEIKQTTTTTTPVTITTPPTTAKTTQQATTTQLTTTPRVTTADKVELPSSTEQMITSSSPSLSNLMSEPPVDSSSAQTIKPIEEIATKTPELVEVLTDTNDVLNIDWNMTSIVEDVTGNTSTNEIDSVKPIVESTTKPSLVTWTIPDEEPIVANTTDGDWVPITSPDGWQILPSVLPTTDEPLLSVSSSPVATTTTTSASTEDTSSLQPIPTTSDKIQSTITTTEYGNISSTGTTYEELTTFSSESNDTVTEVSESNLNMSDYTDVCGRRIYPEARIVGGEKSSFGKWPWQISLRQWRTSTYLHKCGAALLSEHWAITAAHCVESVPPSDLLLRLGEYDLATESEPYLHQERRVQIVASHPQFDPRSFEYDLALLRFYEPVKFQPNILPVCVPQTDDDFIGRNAFVTGWGRLYEDGPLPNTLQEVKVPVINNTLCETMYRSAGYIEHIPHIFICAGWRRGGYDSCEGDSGGPMVIQREDKRFLLAGVISWGIGCAEPNQPGVYTRISEFRDWINQILQF